ncbi:hypothetical protein BYT27DRAFT_7182550 [Phlegmacium glaucopus]|nr:hypothetical protein BYT27DRAFT_7182550 [Phlegmacium glaucopus]
MGFYLVFQFFLQILGTLILAVLVLSKTRSIAGREVFTGCLIDIPDWAYLVWIQPLLVESILVVLVVYKCRKYGGFSPTIKIIARDSVVYFVSVTAILIFNFVYSSHHKLLGTALTLPTGILACIAAARLSMNIRSISMDRALSSLGNLGHFVPTLMFRSPESITYGTGAQTSSDVIEDPEGMYQQDDEENQDQLLELDEMCSSITAPSRM